MDNASEVMKDFFERQIKKELDEKPTFSEDMAEHIRNTYADLQKQKEEWLKSHRQKSEGKS